MLRAGGHLLPCPASPFIEKGQTTLAQLSQEWRGEIAHTITSCAPEPPGVLLWNWSQCGARTYPDSRLTFLLEWPRQSETLPLIRLCTSALSSNSEGDGDQSWARRCTRDSSSWAEGRLAGPSRALEYSAGFPLVAVEDRPGRASLEGTMRNKASGQGEEWGRTRPHSAVALGSFRLTYRTWFPSLCNR
jgi:hypothetical protein